MTHRTPRFFHVSRALAALACPLLWALPAGAALPERSKAMVERTEAMAETVATGNFDVILTPVSGAPVDAMTIAKTFHGDLDGTSAGQMLAVRAAVDGSAGYVAMERVTATLAHKSGSFALQHSGSMDRGVASLSVTVVPDSGTGGLAGLTGSMEIDIAGGNHAYVFHYSLPE